MATKKPNKNPAPKGQRKGQKPTNKRKSPNNTTMGGKEEKHPNTELAKVGNDHDTFVTIKRKTAMLTALRHTMGIVSPAADMVGIPRQTHYVWMKSDAGYKDEVESIQERTYDFVETKMVERINAGSDTMLIWYSKTKMKQRGFVEKTELEVTEKPSFIIPSEKVAADDVLKMVHKKTGTNDK